MAPPKIFAWCRMRYLYAVMASSAMAIVYGVRLNLSVGIVAMVNHSAVLDMKPPKNDGKQECPGKIEKPEDGPFTWEESVQGDILASYFIGYLFTQFPGGFIAQYISAKWLLFGAIACNILGTALIPAVAWVSYKVVIVVRVFTGLAAGVTFPTVTVMTARWAPPSERSVITAVAFAGCSLGSVLAILLSGVFAKYMGWEWVFYMMALMSSPWLLVWALIITDDPNKSKYISDSELEYILDAQAKTTIHGKMSKKNFPCKDVVKSLPFWAVLINLFCNNAAWYMFQTMLPSFMKSVLKKNIGQNALLSAFPYFLNWLLGLILGFLMDYLCKRKMLTIGQARKICTGIATVIPAACLVGASFIGCNFQAGVALMAVGVLSLGGFWVGCTPNHIDISPNFGGLLFGITNTFATVPGIVMPGIIGRLTEKENTLKRWSIAFYIIAAMLCFSCIFFAIFGSGEVQAWNYPKEEKGPENPEEEEEEEEDEKE